MFEKLKTRWDASKVANLQLKRIHEPDEDVRIQKFQKLSGHIERDQFTVGAPTQA